MEIKLLEIRDHSTCIPGLAVKFAARNDREFLLAQRAGYNPRSSIGFGENLIMLTYLVGEKLATCDPYAWGDRTMQTAHQELISKWDEYLTGAVVDVRYILGEVSEPCQTDLGR